MTSRLNILITICARGGSKGVPGKNIKPLNGKPLISYTIKTAKTFAGLHGADIIVSTDDDKIAAVCSTEEIAVHQRPPHLATDTAGKIETIVDVLLAREQEMGKTYDYVLDMDVTSPLRTMTDLETAFGMIQADRQAYNLYSVSVPNRNPYFNMVERKPNGYYHVVKEGKFLSRQSAPEVFDMNASFYFYKRAFFDTGITTSTTERSMIYVVPHICFDVDEPIDFEIMDYLVTNNKLGFEL